MAGLMEIERIYSEHYPCDGCTAPASYLVKLWRPDLMDTSKFRLCGVSLCGGCAAHLAKKLFTVDSSPDKERGK